MARSEFIARAYGTAALLSYDQRVRELRGQGVSVTEAQQRAELWLTTCSKCEKTVSMKKRPGNRRQRADGGIDHVHCEPESTGDPRC